MRITVSKTGAEAAAKKINALFGERAVASVAADQPWRIDVACDKYMERNIEGVVRDLVEEQNRAVAAEIAAEREAAKPAPAPVAPAMATERQISYLRTLAWKSPAAAMTAGIQGRDADLSHLTKSAASAAIQTILDNDR